MLPFCHVRLHCEKLKDSKYPSPLVSLADHIRASRIDRGVTQRAVAAAIGVNVSTLESWENGRFIPIEPHIPRIISFLGYNPLPVGETLGERLRFCRLTLGLPATRLGRQLGVDGMSVRRWEQGLHKPKGKNKDLLEQFIAEHRHFFEIRKYDGDGIDPESCGKQACYRKRPTPTRSQN